MAWVATAVTVGGAVYKGIEANQQDTKAKRLKPTGYVPPEAKEAEQLAEQQANATTYAGQSADENRNNRVVSNSVGDLQRNAKSASDVLNGASNIQAGLGSKMAETISSRYQQFKQGALSRLIGAKGNVAGYQNLDQQQTLNYQRQLEGAATQNRFGAVNDIAGAAASYGDYKNGSPYNYNGQYWR